MKKICVILSLLLIIGLTGCATPAITLKNGATGQIVRCGGDSTGSMTGGMIGYNIQKDNDEKCVKDYEAQGFRRVQ
jgi:hypothetical protein